MLRIPTLHSKESLITGHRFLLSVLIRLHFNRFRTGEWDFGDHVTIPVDNMKSIRKGKLTITVQYRPNLGRLSLSLLAYKGQVFPIGFKKEAIKLLPIRDCILYRLVVADPLFVGPSARAFDFSGHFRTG